MLIHFNYLMHLPSIKSSAGKQDLYLTLISWQKILVSLLKGWEGMFPYIHCSYWMGTLQCTGHRSLQLCQHGNITISSKCSNQGLLHYGLMSSSLALWHFVKWVLSALVISMVFLVQFATVAASNTQGPPEGGQIRVKITEYKINIIVNIMKPASAILVSANQSACQV